MYKFAITPVVTEKSTQESTEGKYHFFVPKSANKIEVKKQLEKMYGEKIASINSYNTRQKTRIVGRGREITKRPSKKRVVVTFKDNKTIDIAKINK